MKVSCIIPTRNRCRMTLRAVASVKNQRYPDQVEIIVVDDGSSDGTADVLLAHHSDIILVRQEGMGAGPARNRGASRATGDIFMFLDSDDMWLEDHIRSLMTAIKKGYHAAYGVTHTIDEINGEEFLIPDRGIGQEGACFRELTRWCFLVPSSFAITRQAFNEVEGFPSCERGEDWAFFLKVADRFLFGFAGPEPITHRYLHNGSLCFLEGNLLAENVLGSVEKVLLSASQTVDNDIERIKKLKKWTDQNSGKWCTIQDWYTSMKIEGYC